jgi:hypothetical protein
VVKPPFFVNKVLEGGGPDHASKIAWQIGSDTFEKESDHTTGLQKIDQSDSSKLSGYVALKNWFQIFFTH